LPLKAVVVADEVYDRFRLQKIRIEWVSGGPIGLNLFLPLSEGPHPPIIVPCGHGPKWLDDHQLPPQVFARNSFAAALFDAPMFGEKRRDNDHFVAGSQCNVVGIWSNLYFVVDAMRTMDYLATRDDIDSSRGFGVTGVSGGGFTTLMLGLLDSRVSSVAPVCAMAPFTHHIVRGLYTGCPETFLFGQLRVSLDIPELMSLLAPRPCLVVAGTCDELFRPAGVQEARDKVQRAYGLHGAEERFAYYEEDSPHSYTISMAVQVTRWMQNWLLDKTDAVEIDNIAPLPADALDCGTADTVEGMRHYVTNKVTTLRSTRRPRTSDADLRRILHLHGERHDIAVEKIEPAGDWDYSCLKDKIQRTILHSSDEVPLPLLELTSPTAPARTVVAFSDAGKFPLLRQTEGLFGVGSRIIAADLRGYGELQPEVVEYDIYGWCSIDRVLSDIALLCGETPLGQQTQDALRVLQWVGDGDLIVYGRGEAALPALFAAILHPQVRRIVLDSFLSSFAALAMAPSPTWSRYSYLYHALEYFDLPELLQQHQEKKFLLLSPCDACHQRLDEVAVRELYGETGHITIDCNSGRSSLSVAIAEWVSEQ
jgi:hypothetical protein